MFTLAVEHRYLATNPMSGVKRLKENNHRHRVLTSDERQRFIAACLETQNPGAYALLLSLYTGMRIGEVLSIKTPNIHLDAGYLVLPVTKNGQQHVVPLSTHAIAAIKEQQRTSGIKDFLFFSLSRPDVPLSYPRYAFEQICKRADIQGLCIHDLRRTFATTLLQETGDLALAAQALNHNSLETTRIYARYQVNELIARINGIQEKWGSVHHR
jgi:integrase